MQARQSLPYAGQEDVVYSPKLDVNLETQVGESLGGGLVHILGLYALCGQTKHDVPDTFHLGCKDKSAEVSQIARLNSFFFFKDLQKSHEGGYEVLLLYSYMYIVF